MSDGAMEKRLGLAHSLNFRPAFCLRSSVLLPCRRERRDGDKSDGGGRTAAASLDVRLCSVFPFCVSSVAQKYSQSRREERLVLPCLLHGRRAASLDTPPTHSDEPRDEPRDERRRPPHAVSLSHQLYRCHVLRRSTPSPSRHQTSPQQQQQQKVTRRRLGYRALPPAPTATAAEERCKGEFGEEAPPPWTTPAAMGWPSCPTTHLQQRR
ncbi:uncharacterized protein LOC119300060 [Triticum dicoccoides]|uniref:uncharacterized protein LOC119300060 n=1 Tax=Triticum dicoccoides TaxID=85692 RepID=UPI00188E80C6|nr:uncharacterized protein LOC119300060 [Triticum dicoccoides]